jgi:hypothetical protein
MSRRIRVTAAMLGAIGALACEGTSPSEPAPHPRPLTGMWSVTHVGGAAMPNAVLYLFDPATLNGQEVSVHWVVDSSQIVFEAGGGYEHRTWVTEWVGDVGGPPLVPAGRLFHGDFGAWTRHGALLEFESGWLQNHRMTGAYADDGVLRMQHGFTHGDSAVAFRYGRGGSPEN